jgi:hypothetical protein
MKIHLALAAMELIGAQHERLALQGHDVHFARAEGGVVGGLVGMGIPE